MSIAIIINPISGGAHPAAAGRRVALATAVVAAHGDAADVVVTERPGHARELAVAAAASGARLVIAWGGDGTVNEVASALAFGPTPMGIVAAGSGNGLARELGVDRRPDRAIADALHAVPRAIDAGELGGRFFVNLAGVGFDARVAERVGACGSGRRGFLTYVVSAARELLVCRPFACRIASGGRETPHRVLFVSLANSPQFGNGARIAPRARVDDGLLDLVVFEEVSRMATIRAMPRLFLGGLERVRGLSTRQVAHVVIESDRPMVFHVDGEPVSGGARLEGRVHPGALRVCVGRA
jgi:YegS/Rv2252/BmrU family lipid kinase